MEKVGNMSLNYSQKAKCNGRNINNDNEQPCEQKVRDQTAQRKDRRVVFVKLTERGERAYHHHADYHRQMTEAILDKLDEKELPVLIKTLELSIVRIFNGYSEEPENK